MQHQRQKKVQHRDRKRCNALRPTYTAANADDALTSSTPLRPSGRSLPRCRACLTCVLGRRRPVLLSLPEDHHQAVHTTNSIENPNRQIRKSIKTRAHLPDEQATTKLIYLANK